MGKLRIEVHMEQVEDGRAYKGQVQFGEKGLMFQYELACDQCLGDLDKLAVTDLEAAKRQMHIRLKDSEGRHVPIPGELISLFERMILPLAADFYADPTVRHFNSEKSRSLAARLAPYGASIGVGKMKHYQFEEEILGPILKRHFG